MKKHSDNHFVCASSWQALGTLCIDENNRSKLISSQTCELVVESLSKHIQHPEMAFAGSYAIEKLCESKDEVFQGIKRLATSDDNTEYDNDTEPYDEDEIDGNGTFTPIDVDVLSVTDTVPENGLSVNHSDDQLAITLTKDKNDSNESIIKDDIDVIRDIIDNIISKVTQYQDQSDYSLDHESSMKSPELNLNFTTDENGNKSLTFERHNVPIRDEENAHSSFLNNDGHNVGLKPKPIITEGSRRRHKNFQYVYIRSHETAK